MGLAHQGTRLINRPTKWAAGYSACTVPRAPRIALVGRKVPTRLHIWAGLEQGHQLNATAMHISPRRGSGVALKSSVPSRGQAFKSFALKRVILDNSAFQSSAQKQPEPVRGRQRTYQYSN